MYELKEREKAVLDYIKEQLKCNGYLPTVRDICSALGIKSTSTVQRSMEILERAGCIRRKPGKKRAFEILDAAGNTEEDPVSGEYAAGPQLRERTDVTDIPLIGRVAAGTPILSEQNIEGSFPVPSAYAPRGNCFMLTVRGESMVEAGIFSGDYILVQEQNTAENGDMVVAMIDGDYESEATVKIFYRREGYIELQPRNSSMSPIIVKDCRIVGIVKGVFRYFS